MIKFDTISKKKQKLDKDSLDQLQNYLNKYEGKLMRPYNSLFSEAGGQASGKMEIDKITYQQALDFCNKRDFDVLNELPHFEKSFKETQRKAKMGWTKRKDMPVIEDSDVKELQKRLEAGRIDVTAPYAPETKKVGNPFPTGLSGLAAKNWLVMGLRDGDKTDDIIDVSIEQVKVSNLIPIQKQIYFDKSMGSTIEFGVDKSVSFIAKKSFFIISSNNYIIDGHHRFLSGMLINPEMKVNALMIDMPIKELLPMTLSYSDAKGNKRNA